MSEIVYVNCKFFFPSIKSYRILARQNNKNKEKHSTSFATVALLSWICAIKKNYAVLELGKLEYHATQYSSIPSSSIFFLKYIYIYTVLELGKLEYCVNFFFFLFGDNQQINIKIKISIFFYVFIYLNRSIVKCRDFNFEIWI